MPFNSDAFERYRRSPNERTTLARLLLGTLIVVLAWVGTTLLTITAGAYVHATRLADSGTAVAPDMLGSFMASPAGILTALLSFSGIWLGLWIAMRWLHAEPLAALFGNSRSVSRNAFLKGLAAVLVTSLVSEVLLFALRPEIGRGPVALTSWLLFLVPILLLTFLQTSSEEMLFRAYLPRGLGKLFRSPLVWGLLPLLVFTSLHWSPATSPAMNFAGLAAIGAFALVLMILVYVTGNVGAAFGAHLGNNLFGFLLISHQQSYSAFSLFTAAPLEGPDWTSADALLIAVIGIVSSALTLVLLVHPRSFLHVRPDLGQADAEAVRPASA